MMNQAIFDTLKAPSGGALPIYQGSRKFMTGSGFLSTIGRFIFPIIKNLGQRLLKTGVRAGSKILAGEPFRETVVSEFVDEGIDMAEDAVKHVRKKRGRGGRRPINKKQKPDVLHKVRRK
jgi:hypothetical protein